MDKLKLFDKNIRPTKVLISIFLFCIVIATASHASEKEDLTVLRNTVVNLLQNLVEQGIMSQDQANALVEKARSEAAEEAAAEPEEIPADVVRVPYVPEIVKDEIRQQVRDELRREVVDDVVAHAKRERWGVRDALPGWLNRIKISGDIRARHEEEIFDNSNTGGGVNNPYFDYAEFNENGPFTAGDVAAAPFGEQGFINTSENRSRQRVRLRLSLDAKINDDFSAGVRISTGNTNNPVSTNQTLGDGSSPKDLVLDRAFIEYNAPGERDWLTITAGRFANPWYSTELVFDNDLNFEGVAGTLRWPINFGSKNLYSLDNNDREIFLTMGVFPLDEFERSSSLDRWLVGGQIGGSWKFSNQSSIKLAAAYYDFSKVQAPSAPDDFDDFLATAPSSLQQGNTIFPVLNPLDVDGIPGSADDTFLFGLASDYDLINFTGSIDIANFAPHHIIFTADYVRNIGYNSDEVNDRILADVSEQTTGYQLTLEYGWKNITNFGHWNTWLTYKSVERDAVLDAFTDSNFHSGGTDAQGWELGGNFGISQNTWITLTWITADEIDGPALQGIGDCGVDAPNEVCNFGVDLIQLDLNSRF